MIDQEVLNREKSTKTGAIFFAKLIHLSLHMQIYS